MFIYIFKVYLHNNKFYQLLLTSELRLPRIIIPKSEFGTTSPTNPPPPPPTPQISRSKVKKANIKFNAFGRDQRLEIYAANYVTF